MNNLPFAVLLLQRHVFPLLIAVLLLPLLAAFDFPVFVFQVPQMLLSAYQETETPVFYCLHFHPVKEKWK